MSHRKPQQILAVWLGIAIHMAASGCSSDTKPDFRKFEGVYRAAKAVEGATNIGVAPQRLQELLQNLSAEVLIAAEFATTKEESLMVREYDEALTAYKDSGVLWKNQLDNGRWAILYRGQIVYSADTAPIAIKYGLATRQDRSEGGSYKFTSIEEDAIQRVWMVAGSHVARADSTYLLRVRPIAE